MTQVHTEPVKRTRAKVLKDKVVIRLALDEIGPEIEKILRSNDIELSCERVFPHWLVATVDDDVIAVAQVAPAHPVGHLAYVATKPAAAFKLRAIALRKLLIQAMATCHAYGSQYVSGAVPAKFADIAGKLNFVPVDGVVMMKRLT